MVSPTIDLASAIRAIDNHICTGDLAQAQSCLKALVGESPRGPQKKLNRKKPTAFDERLAELCLQVGWPHIAFPLLKRLYESAPESMSPEFPLTASRCLLELGAERGAAHWLNVAEKQNRSTDFLLLRARFRVLRWDYDGALTDLLELQIRQGSAGSLETDAFADREKWLTIHFNIAAAQLSSGNLDDADALVQSLLHHPVSRAFPVRAAMLLEIAVEISFQRTFLKTNFARDDWGPTLERLTRAREFISAHPECGAAIDSIFVQKWENLICLSQDAEGRTSRSATGMAPQEKILERLWELRGQASREGAFEAARDIDLWVGLILRRSQLVSQVLMGTRFSSFQKRVFELAEACGMTVRRGERLRLASPRSMYDWINPERPAQIEIDIAAGEVRRMQSHNVLMSRVAVLKPGQTLHRLLVAICLDFYRPSTIAELFFSIHPDRHFDPETSRPVVHQGVRRLRKFFADYGIDVQIKSVEQGLFRLESQDVSIELAMPIDAANSTLESRDTIGVLLARLNHAFGDSPFSSSAAAEAFSLSLRSTQAILATACEEKRIIKSRGVRGSSLFRLQSIG